MDSWFRSISFKLTAAVSVLILAVVAFQVLYFPARQAADATEALRVKARSVTSLVSHDVVAGFEFGDVNAVKEVFRGAENDPDLRFLVLLDEAGKEFAATGTSRPNVTALPSRAPRKEEISGSYLFVSERITTQGGTGGTLIGGFSTDRIRAARRRNQLMAIPIGLAVFIPGVLLAVLISRYVTRRLQRLGSMAERVAQGDLTTTVESGVDAAKADEIEQLTRSFSFMASNLKMTIRKVIESEGTLSSVSETVSARSGQMISGVDQQRTALDNAYQTIGRLNSAIREIAMHVETLRVTAEETSAAILEMVASQTEIAQRTEHLFDSVSQTSAATVEMVAAITQVDKSLDYLRGFVTETSASIAEMSASIGQVESNAAHSYQLAQAVAEAAEAGRKAVTETIEEMERVRNASARTNERVSRLGQRSTEIGEILTVIQSITQQTNLLALNAAILAAQAGQHGTGFSVVADEIRELSDRTSSSTKDIAKLIESVQAEVREALTATAESSKMVEQAAALSVSAGDRLAAILDSARKSLDMGRNIANTTREQAQGSEVISGAVGRLDDLVKQISAAMSSQTAGSSHITRALETMRDVATHNRYATSEQKNTADRIAQAADSLMMMSQQMSRLVSDHASESGKIVGAMSEVRVIADGNKLSAGQMNDSVGSLQLAIQTLTEEVRKFRIDH